jgi:tetraacyldisaccharide 4'-kinase
MDLISGKFLNIVSENKIIITTEKDYSRLCTEKTFDKYRNLPLFYIPVEMEFQEKDKIFFNQTLLDYVRKNQ